MATLCRPRCLLWPIKERLVQLTNLAIKRPLIVLIGVAALLAFGLLSVTRLGVQLLPTMDVPVVNITTVYPGAGPDAVDTLVTRKIEDAVTGLNEVDNIQATSLEGISSVRITFTEKAPKDSTQEVERRVNAVRADLPTDAKTPTVLKEDGSSDSIMYLTLSGDKDLGQLQQLAEDTVKKDLETASGVSRAELVGGLVREI